MPPALLVAGRWSAAELGAPAHATFRCLLPLPGGGVALGSDYGLTLYRGGRLEPFPFPDGSRREGRRVEAMALWGGALYVASAKNWYYWPFSGEARGRALPRDVYGVVDDLRTLHATPTSLLFAWRSHLEGASGPPDCVSFAESPRGTWAGTLDGELHLLGRGRARRFADEQGRPWSVRYLAWQQGGLWVAAGGALHRLKGAEWSERAGEPYDLHTDASGRLWALEAGALWCSPGGGWPERMSVPLSRPWALTSGADGSLWVGEVGRVTRLEVRG